MAITMRITGLFAVLLAAGLLFLILGPQSVIPQVLAKFTLGNDEEAQRIVDAPSVVEQFTKNQGDRNQNRSDATSPLVKQAETFAGILNPPEPAASESKAPTRTPPGRRPAIVKPVATSTTFTLVGTSYSASDPQSSFAFIRLADSSSQWVRTGDEVGHLMVKEIRDRSILCRDGNTDVEMTVDSVPDTASLLETPSSVTVQTQAEPAPARPEDGRITGPPVPRPWNPGPSAPPAQSAMDPEARERLEALGNRIRASRGGNPAVTEEERLAMMKKMVDDFKASRVSPEETEDVEDLGRELNESNMAPPNQGRPSLPRKLRIPPPPK